MALKTKLPKPKKGILTAAALAIATTMLFMQNVPSSFAQDVKTPEQDTVYRRVDQMPKFPGGSSALNAYLAKALVLPESVRKHGIEGRVIAQFVVGADGLVRDVKIVKSLSPDSDSIVKRVLKNMPRWTPGRTAEGKQVPVYYTIPVSFQVE